MRLHGERHVVERGELAQHGGDLERAREPQPHAGVRRQARDVVARRSGSCRSRAQLAGELGDQRRLAGAVGADQRVDLARPHVDRDVVGRDQAAEALDQPGRCSSGSAIRAAPAAKSMPPRAYSAISTSIGPNTICQYSPQPLRKRSMSGFSDSSSTKKAMVP